MSDEVKPKHAGGRPRTYNETLHPKLAEALARNGLTNEQIAEKMGIDRDTLYAWQKDYIEFSDSIKRGKEEPDDQVERSLFKMATGFAYEAEKPMVVSDGKDAGSHIEIAKYRERVIPNTTAQIFWLKNRRPDRWRDRQEVNLNTGPLEIKVTHATEGI